MTVITFLFIILQAFALVSKSYQQCSEIEPPEHGRLLFDSDYRYYQVSCDPGYIIHGKPVVYCRESDWNSPRPTCSKNVCEALPDPENGQVQCDKGLLLAGRGCRFICNDGYQLQGVEVKRCLPNLQWSGPTTKCIPISSTFCELPPPLLHGSVIDCTSVTVPRVSEKCTFRCNAGYHLRGPAYLTCRSNGKLTDNEGKENFPECVALGTPSVQEYRHEGHDEETLLSPKQDDTDDRMPSYGERLSQNPKNKPCQNLGGCQHICKNEGGRAKCRCRRGYSLADDQKSCIETSLSEHTSENYKVDQRTNVQHTQYNGNNDYDSRQPSNTDPCFNHQCEQQCLVEEGRAQCRCNVGYKLKDDQTTCRLNKPCKVNNGGCDHWCSEITREKVSCRCRPGYTIGTDGKSCIRNTPVTIPPMTPAETCDVNNGGCQHHCRMTRMSTVYCLCQRGYKLHSDGKHCDDVDECSDENLNPCQHYCHNTEGSYTCSCKPGYIRIDGYKCEGCGKNSYWSHEFNGCVDCPRNSHTDSGGKLSVRDCVCNSGYNGNPGSDITCKDINECRNNNFGCSETCVNIPGDAYCTCPDGFMLDNDNKTCIDTDECSIKNGGCEGLCHNTKGSFSCSCPEGFTSSEKDQYSCDDVDECLENNGGCEQYCINYRGGYYCSCKTGYHLDGGLKNCTDVQCPTLPVPHYSYVDCKKGGEEKLPDMDNYPVGTICTFHCLRGFKNTGDLNKMKCQIDGTWKGSLPECKAQYCFHLEVPENGDVYPSDCSTQGVAVKQKCTFTCRPGYVLEGPQVFVCKNNLTWNVKDIPICKPVKIQPTIECFRDIRVTLLNGKDKHNITLPEPTTNMDNYNVLPPWVSTGKPIEFPAGVTKVKFTVVSPISNRTAKCVTTVTVLDEEPPVFEFCPDPIKIEGAGGDGVLVTWEEPVVADNVELVSIFSILEPNTTLTPGTYFVEYVARDSSGNTATCSFDVSVIRMNCSDLADPTHGEASCMDWMFGKLCSPQCDDGYMRDPDEPPYYSCDDDSGVWEPGDVISECLQFLPTNSSICQDGFQLKTIDDTGGEVCVECLRNTVWSAATRKCERTVK